jgi:metal-responsive CopG/Arc/MetJ family transcriptional regulator
MSPKGSRTVKVRITASFDPAVVRTIDRLAKVTGHSSRSRLIEEALQYWITAQQPRNLEQQIEAYYLSLSEAEREEDREWAEGASHAATALWD